MRVKYVSKNLKSYLEGVLQVEIEARTLLLLECVLSRVGSYTEYDSNACIEYKDIESHIEYYYGIRSPILQKCLNVLVKSKLLGFFYANRERTLSELYFYLTDQCVEHFKEFRSNDELVFAWRKQLEEYA